MEREYLNIKEASEFLGVSRMTIYRMIERGLKVTTAKHTRRLISKSDLKEFLYNERS